MIQELDFPETLTGQELDEYLSRGWYRSGRLMFSTRYLENEDQPVSWLRMVLSKVRYGKSQKKILRKNAGFTIEIKPFVLTAEIEALFDLHKKRIDFAGSVAEYLMDIPFDNIFNTRQFEIRDGDRLIAVGFIDLGEKSVAAILNFFHPEYKTYSLGIYLLLQEIQYSIDIGMQWFYPGYIVKGVTKFDYKLFPDKRATERWEVESGVWVNAVKDTSY